MMCVAEMIMEPEFAF